jgi:hypothetical protein
VAIEARDKQRLSSLQWLSNHIKYLAKDGKTSTTLLADYCQFFIDEDWEQLKNRGYHIAFNYEDDIVIISWEKDYGI